MTTKGVNVWYLTSQQNMKPENYILNVIKENNCQLKILYPVKTSFKDKGNSKRYCFLACTINVVKIVRKSQWSVQRYLGVYLNISGFILWVERPIWVLIWSVLFSAVYACFCRLLLLARKDCSLPALQFLDLIVTKWHFPCYSERA